VSETIKVADLAAELLALAKPLAAFDMPLLDAHGATLALDVTSGERVVMKSGSRIRSTQIGLAASLGLDHLPTRPQPRVVVVSVGDDLVEPGSPLRDGEDEFETNSWLLTTAVKEAGAVGYRVHTIPEKAEALKDIVEDQLVRSDLIVICGESHDESFDLSDPIFAYISTELFIRPMIRNMMGLYDIHRPVIKATLTNDVASETGRHSFIRGILSTDNPNRRLITAIENQGDLVGLSDATGLIVIPESASGARAGEEVDVLVLERRFN